MLAKAYKLLNNKLNRTKITYDLLYKYQTDITSCTPEERKLVSDYIENAVSSSRLLDKVNRDIYNEALEKRFKKIR